MTMPNRSSTSNKSFSNTKKKNGGQHNNNEGEQASSSVVNAGFGASHPRQRLQARRSRRSTAKTRGTRRGQAAAPTQELATAMKKLEQYILHTTAAQEALDQVQSAMEALELRFQPPETLTARHKLIVTDPTPYQLVQPFDEHHVRLFRATYETNDPSEDRSTVVIGEDFLFAGVWDGHGGWQCSEYVQNTIFENFAEAWEDTQPDVRLAFKKCFQKQDKDYYTYLRSRNKQDAFFAGTCAVACFLDLTREKLWCANLGDSRAVMGVFRDNGRLDTKPLSVDHTAASVIERQRIQSLFPDDPRVVTDLSQDYEASDEDDSWVPPPEWRVKKLAAFTRSIGDLQLKEKNTSALFNSYMPPENQILPRPGVVNKNSNTKTPPYISTEPEVKEFAIKEAGFVIIACDGVWDEMSSEEAVNCVANLLNDHRNSNVNIADIFIEKVLERAVQRLRAEDEYEADITLEELKQRPLGKATDGARSLLHDDITVVIIQLGSTAGHHYESLDPMRQSTSRSMFRSSSSLLNISLDPMRSMEDLVKKQQDGRVATDKQIVEMMEIFEGMSARHLKILFNALDVDGNGSLDKEEVGRLINQVMLTEVTPAAVDLAFGEMDDDGSGAVDFEEFLAFFGHSKDELR